MQECEGGWGVWTLVLNKLSTQASAEHLPARWPTSRKERPGLHVLSSAS